MCVTPWGCDLVWPKPLRAKGVNNSPQIFFLNLLLLGAVSCLCCQDTSLADCWDLHVLSHRLFPVTIIPPSCTHKSGRFWRSWSISLSSVAEDLPVCPQVFQVFLAMMPVMGVRETALLWALKIYKHELWVSSGVSDTISMCLGSVSKFLHCTLQSITELQLFGPLVLMFSWSPLTLVKKQQVPKGWMSLTASPQHPWWMQGQGKQQISLHREVVLCHLALAAHPGSRPQGRSSEMIWSPDHH